MAAAAAAVIPVKEGTVWILEVASHGGLRAVFTLWEQNISDMCRSAKLYSARSRSR